MQWLISIHPWADETSERAILDIPGMVGDDLGWGLLVSYYYGGDNISLSSCGWQHLNSWLVDERSVQSSATIYLFTYELSPIRWLVKIFTNKSHNESAPSCPGTRLKIKPRYALHGLTFPAHPKKVNQCCFKYISPTVGNHLNIIACNCLSVSCFDLACSMIDCPTNCSLNKFNTYVFFFAFDRYLYFLSINSR